MIKIFNPSERAPSHRVLDALCAFNQGDDEEEIPGGHWKKSVENAVKILEAMTQDEINEPMDDGNPLILHLARHNSPRLLSLAAGRGADLEATWKTGDAFVNECCPPGGGKDEGLLARYFASDEFGFSGKTALGIAFHKHYLESALALLRAGSDCAGLTLRGAPYLPHESMDFYYDLVRAMLEQGAYPPWIDDHDQGLWHYAAAGRERRWLDLAIAYPSAPDKLRDDLVSPLELATACGNAGAIEYISSRMNGAAGSARVLGALAPDFAAALRKRDYGKAMELVLAGAPVDVPDHYGNMPLSPVLMERQFELARAMLARGAPTGDFDSLGQNLWHFAAGYHRKAYRDLAIEFASDPDKARKDGQRPLHVAANSGNADAIEALLLVGADPRLRGKNGALPVAVAFACGFPQAASMLVKVAPPVSCTAADGNTELHYAAASGNSNYLIWLIYSGFPVDTENGRGETPLLMAVLYNRPSAVKYLLSNGANPDIRDASGRSVREVANLRASPAIRDLIGGKRT